MQANHINKPFSSPFLSQFVLSAKDSPLTDKEIRKLDQELLNYDRLFLNPEIEKYLITKNELLASFAISKAEFSNLTLEEAQDVYDSIIENKEYDFIAKKLQNGQRLNQKDYDKLEFFNIAKTFRSLNQQSFVLNSLTPEFIKGVHLQITRGLDIFHQYLNGFTLYKSGQWRDNNLIRVGSYQPAPFDEIEKNINNLIAWLKKDFSAITVAGFHVALYAIHPFNNGNKRVCRILEHILLRSLSLNVKNLYSPSYYYHKQKSRYYKYLLYSLEQKNLNHFVSFSMEAIACSVVSVIKTGVEMKRASFLKIRSPAGLSFDVLKPLIKRHELQFKSLFKQTKKKMARQTFVNYLQKAVDSGLIIKRAEGRSVYYRLNLSTPEEETLNHWIKFLNEKLIYVPDELLLT